MVVEFDCGSVTVRSNILLSIATAFFRLFSTPRTPVSTIAHDALVKVFATKKGITVGRQHFELLFPVNIGDLNQ
jgi:hypothetical protein